MINNTNCELSFRIQQDKKLDNLSDTEIMIYDLHDNVKMLSIPWNDYKLDDLIKIINDQLINYDITIFLNKLNIITIKSLNESKFDLIMSDNSILPYLGYTNRMKLLDSNKYIAKTECHLNIDEHLYIYFDNINSTKAFVEYNYVKKELKELNKKILFNPVIKSLNELNVRITNSTNNTIEFIKPFYITIDIKFINNNFYSIDHSLDYPSDQEILDNIIHS
jgi:hypothetical protein